MEDEGVPERDADPTTVTVITPTTGGPLLEDCLESVQSQTYPHVEHLIVIDGPEHRERARQIMSRIGDRHPVHVIELPRPTGRDRFHGHRIYGAALFLCDGAFVAFLDDDNWYEPDHVESLVEIAALKGLSWAYSLRTIVERNGDMIALDDCESLGKWPTCLGPTDFLVDVSCYLIRRDLAIRFSWIWNRRARDPELMEADRILCQQLMKHAPEFDTTGKYTVNYRIGSNPYSVKRKFFIDGNDLMKRRHPNGFPWNG